MRLTGFRRKLPQPALRCEAGKAVPEEYARDGLPKDKGILLAVTVDGYAVNSRFRMQDAQLGIGKLEVLEVIPALEAAE